MMVGFNCDNFSGCLFDKGFFNGIIDPGEKNTDFVEQILGSCGQKITNISLEGAANRDERGRAVDFLGKTFRYKCQVDNFSSFVFVFVFVLVFVFDFLGKTFRYKCQVIDFSSFV